MASSKQAFFPDDEVTQDNDNTNNDNEDSNNNDNNNNIEPLKIDHYCARVDDKLYVLLQLQPFNKPARNAYFKVQHLPKMPVRLVCLIDVSHSMAEKHGSDNGGRLSKIERVKIFGRLLCHVVGGDDHVGLVTFGTHANVVCPLSKMGAENKKSLVKAFEGISLGGVTNLSAGLATAISLFNLTYAKKNRNSNDNIILLTDGMANEGLTDLSEILKDVRRRIRSVQTDCSLSEDYTIRLITAGTNGFFPEVVYNLGQVFSSGPFHHIGESSDLSWALALPLLYMQEVVIAGVKVSVQTENGVTFDDDSNTHKSLTTSPSKLAPNRSNNNSEFTFSQSPSQEYRLLLKHSLPQPHSPLEAPLSPRAVQQQEVWSVVGADDNRYYHISDLAIDCCRHILVPILLPRKHKKALKGSSF